MKLTHYRVSASSDSLRIAGL